MARTAHFVALGLVLLTSTPSALCVPPEPTPADPMPASTENWNPYSSVSLTTTLLPADSNGTPGAAGASRCVPVLSVTPRASLLAGLCAPLATAFTGGTTTRVVEVDCGSCGDEPLEIEGTVRRLGCPMAPTTPTRTVEWAWTSYGWACGPKTETVTSVVVVSTSLPEGADDGGAVPLGGSGAWRQPEWTPAGMELVRPRTVGPAATATCAPTLTLAPVNPSQAAIDCSRLRGGRTVYALGTATRTVAVDCLGCDGGADGLFVVGSAHRCPNYRVTETGSVTVHAVVTTAWRYACAASATAAVV